MTTTVSVLLEPTFATSTATGAFYLSDQCTTALDKVTCTNESGGPATATVQLIAPDGTSIQSFSKTILAGASWPFPDVVGHNLAIGGKVAVTCPTASAIKARMSGRKFT